jgi:hypothetical protein
MSEPQIQITEMEKIGENDHGYWFGVGRLGSRWVGFAMGDLEDGNKMMFLLPGISESYQMGVAERGQAILLTGAIAQDFEHGYGGIARWFIPEELRGKPDDFRCDDCHSVGCAGDCIEMDFFDEP